MLDFPRAADALAQAGRRFDARGWVLGTSGNLSAVVSRDPLRLAITRSGASKGDLGADAFLEVDEAGAVQGIAAGRPSAETALHVEIVRARGWRSDWGRRPPEASSVGPSITATSPSSGQSSSAWACRTLVTPESGIQLR
jgi:hypothetical protein